MDTSIVSIDLHARSYDIYIGAGLYYRAIDFVPENIAGRSIFIIADINVESIARAIQNNLLDAGAGRVEIYQLRGGEKTKSFSHVESVCDWMLAGGVSRRSIVFAVGGGVVGDLAGFCAAIVMRGVKLIQVPTTLLAQVDSSVGGKTGVNTPRGKNLIGSFHQPSAVLIDIDSLKTLPQREVLAGYAEIVKYGLINDAVFFAWLENNYQKILTLEPQSLIHAIEKSVQSKAMIVKADEREETDLRALLNLGHTFGHALEAAAGYDGRLLHGEAVAIGICMAFDLSVRLGICPPKDYERVEQHFIEAGLPVRASLIEPAITGDVEKLLGIMRLDKKSDSGKMRFVVVDGIGHAYIKDDVPEDLVRAVLKDSLGSATQTAKEKWKSAFFSSSA
jgi:3-dehydroquinate synthase